jgi:hypothetical protein
VRRIAGRDRERLSEERGVAASRGDSPEDGASDDRRAPSGSDPVATTVPPTPGFGRFRVLGKAGSGAMGVVYAAYDPTLDRRVALKVLRGAANRGRERDRIRREALALARVSHPNVVSVYEVGEADGRLFVAMEYVDGPDLEAWLASRPSDWRATVAMFAQVGRGLAAAHAQGLVHRDFKPGNVLVGSEARPRIIDFGLARVAEGADDEAPDDPPAGDAALLSSPLTRTGHLLGTPAYMAPELLAGGHPTPASDQFAFCVALFEGLYGMPPFPRDSLPMLRAAMARGELTVPEATAAPAEVLAILRRGLAATPDARWPSLTALLASLDAVDGVGLDLVRGWRARVLVGASGLLLAGIKGLAVLVDGPPADSGEVLRGEGVIMAGLVVLLVAFRRWFGAEEVNRRLRSWLGLFMLIRFAAFAIGARVGMNVAQVFAVDTVILVGMTAFAGPYIGIRTGLGVGSMLAALAGIAVVPAHAVLLHHAGAPFMIVGLLRGEWTLRKAVRARFAPGVTA